MAPKKAANAAPKESSRVVRIETSVSVGELARGLGVKAPEVQRKLMALGTMVSINQEIDLDVLRPHEQVLGRTLAGCIADAGGEVDLREALDPAMLDHIDDRRGRVLASFYGSFGDIGWYSPTWLAFAARARL